MKKRLSKMAAWLCARRRAAASRRKALLACRLAYEARSAVQVREYGGEVWLCLGGQPVLPVDGIKWDLPTALDVSREAWVKKRMEGPCDG